VVFGAGTAGVGIADQLRDAMVRDGAKPQDAARQVWLVDEQGLLVADMDDLRDFQQPYARQPDEVSGWAGSPSGISLADTIRHVHPTILVGTSTAHCVFTQEIVEEICAGTPRPIILPISNPLTNRGDVSDSGRLVHQGSCFGYFGGTTAARLHGSLLDDRTGFGWLQSAPGAGGVPRA
jgi:malic enzyme